MSAPRSKAPVWVLFAGLLAALLVALLAMGLAPREVAVIVLLALNAAVPIALAATGEVITERSGLANVGIEGIIIVGAVSAVWVAEALGSGWLGLAGGAAFGALLGALFGLAATYGRGVQIIGGFGLNMVALGLVAFALFALWKTPGFHMLAPDTLKLPRLALPIGTLSWLVPATVLIALITHLTLFRTRWGAHVRAAGYNPFVTDTAGIDVYRLRTVACMIGGALAGLAGAYLALDYIGSVAKNVSHGRGFIALACIVFSGLNIALAIAVAVLFGLVEAMALWLQNAPWAKGFVQAGGGFALLALPYVSVLLVLAFFPRGEALSKSIGETYRRNE